MSDSDAGSDPGAELRRGSSAVAAGIFLSRTMGLVREIATARWLGTGVGAEAFRAALRVPNLLQNLLGEGVLSAAFVPVYSKLLAERRPEDAGRLAGAIAGLLLVVVSLVVALTVTFAEPITRVLAWGFVPGTQRFELTVTLVRIVTPGVGLLVLSAWCLAILNSHRRFFLAYVAPALWNVAIIAALVTAALVTVAVADLAVAMAWGALVGSVLQFAVQLPTVLRLTRGLHLSLALHTPGVGDVVRRFGQVLTGRGGVQLSAYVDLFAASLLAFGAVAALGYAQVLYLLPVALFGMSVAASELPALSTMNTTQRGDVLARLDAGLGRVAFFVVPATVAFVVAGDLVVATVFAGGRFDADAVVQVGTILAVYGLALPASAGSRLLQSVLYGVGDARSPATYALVRVAVAALVGITLMMPLDAVRAAQTGFEIVGEVGFGVAAPVDRIGPDNLMRMGAAGLAFGAGAGAWLEVVLLRRRVRGSFGTPRLFGSHRNALLLAATFCAVAGMATRATAGMFAFSPRQTGIVTLAAMGAVYLAVTRMRRVPDALALLRSSAS